MTLSWLTNALGALWAALVLAIVWRLPHIETRLVMLSLVFPVYYFALSLWLDRRSRRSSATVDP
jgi:hypothetical protein